MISFFLFFFSLLFTDQQKTTKTKKRGRERGRGRASVLDRAYEEKYCMYGQQGIGVNEKDYNRKLLNDFFLD